SSSSPSTRSWHVTCSPRERGKGTRAALLGRSHGGDMMNLEEAKETREKEMDESVCVCVAVCAWLGRCVGGERMSVGGGEGVWGCVLEYGWGGVWVGGCVCVCVCV